MSNKPVVTRAYYGAVVNPESLDSYNLWPRALIAVDSEGNIAWIKADVKHKEVKELLRKHDGVQLMKLDTSEFLMPGFVDTHTHAPQVPNLGSGQQYELLSWLENVTFPMEEKFVDVEFAKIIYPRIVRKFIEYGTTTCCYYGSLHAESTKVLADTVLFQGQRALIGKCNMNRNCPKTYCETSTAESIDATKDLIAYIRSLSSDLVRPVLTPRFAISCTDDLLLALGQLAKEDPDLHIQTHISENSDEIEFTKSLFPACSSYTDVYLKHGLLTPRTILAHGVHLEDEELEVIESQGAGISHCPTSNFNLSSGMAKVGKMLDRGIKVGLGTDVSGGFSPSMLTVIQHASICSKMVALNTPSTERKDPKNKYSANKFSIATLLFLATMGGAQLCCLEDRIGSFEPGKSFDALFVSSDPREGNPAMWVDIEKREDRDARVKDLEKAKKDLDAQLERFLFGGDNRNILEVLVQGKVIGGFRFNKSFQRENQESLSQLLDILKTKVSI